MPNDIIQTSFDEALFRSEGWPIVRREDFVRDGSATLQRFCRDLELRWADAMIRWSRSGDEIAYLSYGYETFFSSIGQGSLDDALIPERAAVRVERLPRSELGWLEKTFEGFNEAHQYPASLDGAGVSLSPEVLPPTSFNGTARDWWIQEHVRLWEENLKLEAEVEWLRGSRRAETAQPSGPPAPGSGAQ